MSAQATIKKSFINSEALFTMAPSAALATLWILAAHAQWLPEQLLATPSQVIEAAGELYDSGDLQSHLSKSLGRLGLGFLSGTLAGLIFGVLMGLFKTVEAYFGPFFHAIRQVPSIAFIPMLVLIFGIEETFKIVIVAKASFFPVALASYDSVKGLPKGYFEVAKVYQCPLWPLVKRVVIPATVPQVLTGLRLSLSRGWMVLVAAELMAADSGIGQMMEWGRQMFRMDIVVVGVMITGLIGFSLDRGFKWIESRFVRWQTQ